MTTNLNLQRAAEAMTLHTGQLHFTTHESGFFMMHTTVGTATKTILSSRTKKGLVDGVCYYIQGYHAGRRSIS